jgi:c-di-GMP-binding flagellar brake protein YcgR
MERRREVRVVCDQTVRVTVLGRHRQEMQGTAVDLSGRGMRIMLPDRVPPGDAVKVHLDDVLLLGEICYCRPQGRGFVVGIELDQALIGLADLARLNRALADGASEPSEARSDHGSRYPTPR